MKRSFYALTALSLFCMTTVPATSQPSAPDAARVITPAVMETINKWIDSDVVRQSIIAQNERYGDLKQAQIDALDQQWVAEREANNKPLIAATLSNPLSVYLSRMQGRSVGLFVEIFVMDNKGLNVGQSSITGDFWQGDEAKFQKTFPEGGMEVFVDEAEWDKDFNIWRAQINMPIRNKDGSEKIGAVTVEVNLTEAQRRYAIENGVF